MHTKGNIKCTVVCISVNKEKMGFLETYFNVIHFFVIIISAITRFFRHMKIGTSVIIRHHNGVM